MSYSLSCSLLRECAVFTRANTCISLCIPVFMYIHAIISFTYVLIHPHTQSHTHSHTYLQTPTHMYICAFACECAHVRMYINTTLTHLSRTLENRKRQREAILHKRQHAERVKDETQRLYAVFLSVPHV